MAEKRMPAAAPAAGAIAPEQIAAWKREFGKVYVVEADGKKGYLRRPTRKIISAATVIGGNDALRSKEVLIENCWLGGDAELKSEDRYFIALAGRIDEIIEVAQVELKEV